MTNEPNKLKTKKLREIPCPYCTEYTLEYEDTPTNRTGISRIRKDTICTSDHPDCPYHKDHEEERKTIYDENKEYFKDYINQVYGEEEIDKQLERINLVKFAIATEIVTLPITVLAVYIYVTAF